MYWEKWNWFDYEIETLQVNILEQKRPIYSTKVRYPQQANQEKKNELTYYYSSEENESLDGSFGDSAVVKYVFFLRFVKGGFF